MNRMLENLSPISVVVIPDYEVYNSFRDQSIFEAEPLLQNSVDHPVTAVKDEFLKNQFSEKVMSQINGMIYGLWQWDRKTYDLDVFDSIPTEAKPLLSVFHLLNKYLICHADNQVSFYVL